MADVNLVSDSDLPRNLYLHRFTVVKDIDGASGQSRAVATMRKGWTVLDCWLKFPLVADGTIRVGSGDDPDRFITSQSTAAAGFVRLNNPAGVGYKFPRHGTLDVSIGATFGAASALVPEGGAGYDVGETLTVVGGTGDPDATFTVDLIAPVSGQDESDFSNAGDEGTFAAGADYNVADEITLSDGTVITVDAETDGAITAFTVDASLATGSTSEPTLTQSSVSPAGGTGFTLTLGVANQRVYRVDVDEPGVYTVLPTNPVETTSDADGTGAELTVTWDSLEWAGETIEVQVLVEEGL